LLIKNKIERNFKILNKNKKLLLPEVKYGFLDDKKEIL
jgi:hypothetical protein